MELPRSVLSDLPADEIAVLAAVFFDGEGQREIAESMGRSKTWVQRRLTRGLRRLGDFGKQLKRPSRGRRPSRGGRIRYVCPMALDQRNASDLNNDGLSHSVLRSGRRKRKKPSDE